MTAGPEFDPNQIGQTVKHFMALSLAAPHGRPFWWKQFTLWVFKLASQIPMFGIEQHPRKRF